MKSQSVFCNPKSSLTELTNRSRPREDDTNWPKKNIVGKQELEIRVGNDHIAFEVRLGFLCDLSRLC